MEQPHSLIFTEIKAAYGDEKRDILCCLGVKSSALSGRKFYGSVAQNTIYRY